MRLEHPRFLDITTLDACGRTVGSGIMMMRFDFSKLAKIFVLLRKCA